MYLRHIVPFLTVCCGLLAGCGEHRHDEVTNFTKADSVTDNFLALQDSLLHTWNMMINDDNHKIEAMHNVVHELMVGGGVDQDILRGFEDRISRLKHLRYTQKSMANADVVHEYDLASSTLVQELTTLAEAQRQYAYNTTLQKLVANIKSADQRAARYRELYDAITTKYNSFVMDNKESLREINPDSIPDVKPLFRVADN